MNNFTQIDIQLEKSGGIPLFHQIETALEKMIRSGRLQPGDRLPGDVALAGQCGVNHQTVRKAYAHLMKKRLIRRSPKSGTFVADNIIPVTPTIGLYYFKEAEPILLKMLESLQRVLVREGYDLKIFGYDSGFYDDILLTREMREKNLAAAIIMLLGSEHCRKAILELERERFPYIRLGNAVFEGELKAPLIRGNERQGTRTALDYLWKKGHRKIGLIACSRDNDSAREYKSYYQGNAGWKERWFMSVDFSGAVEQWRQMPGREITRGYLELNPDLTAVVVEHPGVTIDVLRQANLMGKPVPQALSLVCLRDWALEAAIPSITAMTVPDDIWAETLATKLLRTIKHGFPAKEDITFLKYILQERESVSTLLKASKTAVKKMKGRV